MKLSRHNDFMFETSNFELNDRLDVVLVIGNGFDLSFGLKTRYSDFMSSDYFEKLIKNKNNFANYLRTKESLINWIDVEKELVNYSSKLNSKSQEFYHEFHDLSDSLVTYLRNLPTIPLEQNNIAFELIEKMFEYKCLVIDFNYTNTLEKVISILSKNKNIPKPSISHVKIHGSLDQNDIIFGVEDNAKINADHIFLKKSVNKNFKANNFSEPLVDCKSLGFFGHSLGKTDHMYFLKYFKSACNGKDKKSNKDVTIYYYGEENRLSLHKEIDILTSHQISGYKQNNNVVFIDTKN